MNKILIVASHLPLLSLALTKSLKEDLTVITPEEAKKLTFDREPLLPEGDGMIQITNPYKTLTSIHEGKQFICKGKHQYKEVITKNGNFHRSTWICQCGRKLT